MGLSRTGSLRTAFGVLAMTAAFGACGTATPQATPAAGSTPPATASAPPTSTRTPLVITSPSPPPEPCILAITAGGTRVSGGTSLSIGGSDGEETLSCNGGPRLAFRNERPAMAFVVDGVTTRLAKGEQGRVGAYEVKVVELSRTAATVEITLVG